MSEVSKVVFGGETIIDLTSDTVTPETLAEGHTAHAANGQKVTGTMPTTTVLYTEQTLTNEQKSQARTNIGAASQVDLNKLSEEIVDLSVFVTPEIFGAVGDGLSDDSEALNKMFNSGYNVFVLDGSKTYMCHDVFVCDGATVYGNGAIMKFNGNKSNYMDNSVSNGYILYNRRTDVDQPEYQKISLNNIVFDCNKESLDIVDGDISSNYTHGFNSACHFARIKELTICECIFKNTIQTALLCYAVNNAKVTDCIFDSIGTIGFKVNYGGSQNCVSLTDSVYLNNSQSTLRINPENIVFRNNKIKSVHDEVMRVDSAHNVYFEGNIVEYCGQYIIEVFTERATTRGVYNVWNNKTSSADSFINFASVGSYGFLFNINNNEVRIGDYIRDDGHEQSFASLFHCWNNDNDSVINICENNVSIKATNDSLKRGVCAWYSVLNLRNNKFECDLGSNTESSVVAGIYNTSMLDCRITSNQPIIYANKNAESLIINNCNLSCINDEETRTVRCVHIKGNMLVRLLHNNINIESGIGVDIDYASINKEFFINGNIVKGSIASLRAWVNLPYLSLLNNVFYGTLQTSGNSYTNFINENNVTI